MTSLEQEDTELFSPDISTSSPTIKNRSLRWTQILAISIFWFALNFHWSAIGVIILPSQVYKLVGELHKGEALALVLVPGAFVSLFANPLFGLLSDRTHGRLALWGRRRPYILAGTIVNIIALVGMAFASDIPELTVAYILVQFSSNAAQAPFHALLPDIVPIEQRGLTSGIMGMLSLVGNVAGAVVAGLFIDSTKSFHEYQQSLWLTYAIIIVILFVFMLITLVAVRERQVHNEEPDSSMDAAQSSTNASQVVAQQKPQRPEIPVLTSGSIYPICFSLPRWLTHSFTRTILGTFLGIAVAWGAMTLWNTTFHAYSVLVSSDVEQVVLEVIATIGILRMFDFHPRRTPDFAWVLLTRLLMMLGIYTIQDFMQYYMRDVVGVAHPEQQVTVFILSVSAASLLSTLAAGWLSDRFGRKRIVYMAGSLMGLVGIIFIFTHSLPIIIAAGAVFGLGYGAYISVDWALVADVLPSSKNYARDMGVWNISLSLPQVIAPILGGPLIDFFARTHQPTLGFQILFAMGVVYCVVATVTIRFIRGVKR